MDYLKKNKVYHSQQGTEQDAFFIEDSRSSESGNESNYGYVKRPKPGKQATQLSNEGSPPLLLAFSSSARNSHDICQSSSSDEQDEYSDQSIEEWMILGGEEQVGDSNIQLNLCYWSSSEDDYEHKDVTPENNKSITDPWVVSDKDKHGADQSLASRYFVASRSSICHICNKMGHTERSCYLYRKCPPCFLCGVQGHIQRDCPVRPCPKCGLPSHGVFLCKVPPVWTQRCQRCGMKGHLSDACPDTWRQYHLTIRLEVPLKPNTVQHLKDKNRSAHCYNCSKRGHYGHECLGRRMVSGIFPSLPYVCHYDTMEDVRARVQKGAKDQEHLCERAGGSGEENPSVQRKSKTKHEANSQTGRRRTWPERRKERRQVKRLRREAQAIRHGGLLGRSCCSSDDDVCPTDSFGHCLHGNKLSLTPSKKKTDETSGKKSRRSKESERWKKRGGIKRGDLHPHGDMDIRSENLLSPKQRVRHRRR